MVQQFTFQEYQGWENKFTWDLFLHLANEQYLYNWARDIVGLNATNIEAGRDLHEEVTVMINLWITRGEQHEMELLVSQLTGDAIGFAEWGDVVKHLIGMDDQVLEVGNPFTDKIVQFYQAHEEHQQELLSLFQAAAERKQLLNKHPKWIDDMNTGRPQHEVIVDKILNIFSGSNPFWAGVDAVKDSIENLNQNWIEDPHRRHDHIYTEFARMLLTQALEVVVWEHVAQSF